MHKSLSQYVFYVKSWRLYNYFFIKIFCIIMCWWSYEVQNSFLGYNTFRTPFLNCYNWSPHWQPIPTLFHWMFLLPIIFSTSMITCHFHRCMQHYVYSVGSKLDKILYVSNAINTQTTITFVRRILMSSKRTQHSCLLIWRYTLYGL